jgi:hypothetical protein
VRQAVFVITNNFIGGAGILLWKGRTPLPDPHQPVSQLFRRLPMLKPL